MSRKKVPPSHPRPKVCETWPANDPRRAFVDGVAWWEFMKEGATIWAADRDAAEAEAEARYPGGLVEKGGQG